ncbi:Keratin, type I cytoskeletal 13 [Lonchura striata]|uniref:Keratin, type I cytoskeletal 13 n=1 Tax=Lonchura striata TaxID=40157 RepID=A0A218UMF6_9PASE|nr:Keratin, type I cytoskeletal 13 [Lonchura striata domestica]
MSCNIKETITVSSKGRSSGGSCIIGGGGGGARISSFGIGSGRGFSGRSYCGGVNYGGGLSVGSLAGGSYGGGNCYGNGLGFGLGGGVVVGGLGGDCLLSSCDEKVTMQNLNDRLASYLDKVKCLEKENAELECRIREWYATQGLSCEPRDYSCYYKEIEDLQNQIVCATIDNNKIILDIDNSRMAADDFRVKHEMVQKSKAQCIHLGQQNAGQSMELGKEIVAQTEPMWDIPILNLCFLAQRRYETELALRQSVEADINGLRQRNNLESSLAETECQYNTLLSELQSQITCVEQQLAEIRAEIECQNQEYKTLLDVKCRLEQEIQTYRCLLEGGQQDLIQSAVTCKVLKFPISLTKFIPLVTEEELELVEGSLGRATPTQQLQLPTARPRSHPARLETYKPEADVAHSCVAQEKSDRPAELELNSEGTVTEISKAQAGVYPHTAAQSLEQRPKAAARSSQQNSVNQILPEREADAHRN